MRRLIFIVLFCVIICLLIVSNSLAVCISKATCIIVSKATLEMTVYDQKGRVLLKFPIACGQNNGQKRHAGDNRTPEGIFRILSKECSSFWTYDFGKGPIKGAYGPLFMRLNTPGFHGIGIHGTHDPKSVPGRRTHGCIRLKNEDLMILSQYVKPGTIVVILPDKNGGYISQK